MTAGTCDRTPCPVAKVGQVVHAELDARRRAALGINRIEGAVSAITPYTHSLVVGPNTVGGHLSTDVITVRR